MTSQISNVQNILDRHAEDLARLLSREQLPGVPYGSGAVGSGGEEEDRGTPATTTAKKEKISSLKLSAQIKRIEKQMDEARATFGKHLSRLDGHMGTLQDRLETDAVIMGKHMEYITDMQEETQHNSRVEQSSFPSFA